jgi:glyoxylase-like metal-dependent hydrolase (beta-lactamase superfamily II)
LLSSLILFLMAFPSLAAGLEVQRVTEDVYALVGELGQRSPQNLGNNATFGVIVTKDGVVLVDPGGSHAGARAIEAALRTVTHKPVLLVINTGGQDHRWLGNGYFKSKGARLVASKAAVADHRARARDQLIMLDTLVGAKGMAGTTPVYADETFEEGKELTVGGTKLVLRHAGPAHTPGDSFVWLPQKKVVFAGDIVYVERLLGVGAESKSGSWVRVFKEMAALEPAHVVPGHGHATTLARARADTYDYLVMLRSGVRELIELGRGIEEVGALDQSRFTHLKVYEELKGRNAQQVYQEMEWEESPASTLPSAPVVATKVDAEPEPGCGEPGGG